MRVGGVMSQESFKIPVDEFTSPVSQCVCEETPLVNVIDLLETKSYRHIPVVQNNKPVGIISQRDLTLFHCLKGNSDGLYAKDIMRADPYCVTGGTLIEDVALEMSKRKIGSALVINKRGELEGIFTSIDGLNALIEIARGDVLESV